MKRRRNKSKSKSKDKPKNQFKKNTKKKLKKIGFDLTRKETLCFTCFKKSSFNLNSKLCPFCKSEKILNERYYLLEILGQNIGVTYKAFDIKADKLVVIKELSIKKVKNWKDEELFKREAATLLSINHTKIPSFIDYFENSMGKKIKYYTVMNFIDGSNLSKVMKGRRYNERMVIKLIFELASILDYLHNSNPPIIHRDIKPTNIVKRKQDGRYVLIDFGSVVDALKPGGDSTIAGTFGYMAPEQFMGKASVKSDYYSLGVVVLELLTNKKPEEFMNGIKLNWQDAEISDYMKGILNYLLAENPNDRIASFDDLKKVLGIKGEDELNRITNMDKPSYNALKDKEYFIEMYQELRGIKELSKSNSFISNISKYLTFLSPIAMFIYFIPSLVVMIISIMSFYYSKMLKHKKQKEFLKDYFPYLTEKELVFFEIILKIDAKNFSLRKKDFYHFYENALEADSLNTSLLMKYNEEYKDFYKLIKADKGDS